MNAPHTHGPWRWEFNAEHRSVHLVGGRPQFDLTVLDFSRWGMHGATPRFRDTSVGGMNLMDRLCDRRDWITPFDGRKHHAHWCAAVIHPDARLMAAAPELLDAVRICLDAEHERRKKLLPNAPATTYCEKRIAMLEAALFTATGSTA